MKNEPLEIKYLDEPVWDIIGGGLSDFNTRQAGDDKGKNPCFILQTPDGETIGGVIGATYWDWLVVNLMWVRKGMSGQEFGRLEDFPTGHTRYFLVKTL